MNKKLFILIFVLILFTGCATYQEVDEYYSEPHIGQYQGVEPSDIEAASLLLVLILCLTM